MMRFYLLLLVALLAGAGLLLDSERVDQLAHDAGSRLRAFAEDDGEAFVFDELEEETNDEELVTLLLEEGVIEEPHVDHEDVAPRTAEHDSDAPLPSVGDALFSDDDDDDEAEHSIHEENEEDDGASNDDDDDDANDDDSTTEIAAQVAKVSKKYKAVNTHFLSLFDAWTFAGWKRTESVNDVGLFLTKPITRVMNSRGKMISQISSSSCIGGSKGSQLRCRQKFLEKCPEKKISIFLEQYNMWSKKDCENYFSFSLKEENKSKEWIGKVGGAFHGAKMSIFRGVSPTIKRRYGACRLDKTVGSGYILQAYVSNPALISRSKFDVRTYLLVASTKPFLAFYHDGFARKSMKEYTSDLKNTLAHITNSKAQEKVSGFSEEHFLGFHELSEKLKVFNPDVFDENFMATTFKAYAKHGTSLLFRSSLKRLRRRAGSFMLFGVDWAIDSNGKPYMLEANGNPTIRHYPLAHPADKDLTPTVWRSMASLLTELHTSGWKNLVEKDSMISVKSDFKYKGWELVYREGESDSSYDPCEFDSYVAKCPDGSKKCDVW